MQWPALVFRNFKRNSLHRETSVGDNEGGLRDYSERRRRQISPTVESDCKQIIRKRTTIGWNILPFLGNFEFSRPAWKIVADYYIATGEKPIFVNGGKEMVTVPQAFMEAKLRMMEVKY